ncbi:MAG: TonB-dependent receptor [Bacteroidales bacterium]|nr:TonB-dependent receptor [Bacteroidales bacterium]
MRKYLLNIFILLSMSFSMKAQEEDLCLEYNYDGLEFAAFADSIAKYEGARIFFKEEWFERVIVIQDENDCSLKNLLENTLSPNGIFYITDAAGNIILTGKEEILTELTPSFFGATQQTSEVIFEDEIKEEDTGEILQTNLASKSIVIGNPGNRVYDRKVNFSGSIRNANSGEPLAGVVVYSENEEVGAITDNNGYFIMSLPSGQHNISLRCIGMENQSVNLTLYESGTANIEMKEEITALRGVIVIADKGKNVSGMQIGLNKVSMELMKQIPAMMGETDVLKTAILLPGVQTVGEGAAGFNVRGGSTDQNLILLNSAPVFNSSHFFGFFSAFNPDIIKEFELYKSGIPAEFGGRVSSVFEITTKSGNTKNISGSGGVSPVTARVMLEGPTVRDKGSFLLGARSTFSDLLLKQFKVASLQRSSASFYDANLIINHKINDKNDLSLSLYRSADEFSLSSDTLYSYNNMSGSAGWKYKISDKLIGETKLIYSHYDYNVTSTENEINAFTIDYALDYIEGRTDFSYFLSNEHRLKFGLNSIWYLLNPGSRTPKGEPSLVAPFYLEKEQANEIAAYISDEYTISNNLSISAGIRVSFYRFLGPKTVNYYDEGPREPYNLIDSVLENGTIQSYGGPEARLSIRYRVDRVSSLKLSYNRMRQNLHMLSNTTAISPTDIWKLSDSYVRPQVGDQLAIGYYRDFSSNTIETSLELYYKNIRDIIEYKGGASLILNPLIETDLINGNGQAYGVELLVKKKYGRLNGLMSYTFSRTLIKVSGEYPEETINRGSYYPANYDKPHDLTCVASYRFNRRFSISTNLTYSTGRPITFPVAKYSYLNNEYVHYSFRNEYHVPDYFRWDLSLNLEGNLKIKKLAHSSWSLSVYNVTGRNNVYSIFFVNRSGKIQGYKLSIFSEPIPTITYSFRF